MRPAPASAPADVAEGTVEDVEEEEEDDDDGLEII